MCPRGVADCCLRHSRTCWGGGVCMRESRAKNRHAAERWQMPREGQASRMTAALSRMANVLEVHATRTNSE
jgi:hypothetical protein